MYICVFVYYIYIYTYVYVWVLIPGLDLSFLFQLRLMPPGLCAWKTISFAWFSFAAQFRNICLEGLGACCLRTTCCTMLGTVFLIQPLAQFGRLEGLHVSCFLAGARPSKLRLGTSNMCGSPIDGAEDSPNGEHPTSPWICGCASHLVYLVMVYNPSHVRTYVKILQ